MAFKLFGNDPKPAEQQPAQQQTSEQPPAESGQQPEVGNQPAAQQQVEQPQGLDRFADLWQDNTSDGNSTDGGDKGNKSLALSGDVLNPIAAKMDFVSASQAETMQAIQAGDLSKLPELLNSVGREAYSKAMEHSTGLVNTHLDSRFTDFKDTMQQATQKEVRSQAVNNTIQTDNPVVRGELQRIAQQLQGKHPDASPDWIRQESEAYLTELTSALNPQAANDSSSQGNPSDGFDFMDYLQPK